jgi:hypothetical protein
LLFAAACGDDAQGFAGAPPYAVPEPAPDGAAGRDATAAPRAGDASVGDVDGAAKPPSVRPDAALDAAPVVDSSAVGAADSSTDGPAEASSAFDGSACLPPVEAHCPSFLCGNGVIDQSCGLTIPGGFFVSEQCDGTQLGTATCASLGQGTGTLACSPDCTFDVSGCRACGDDPRITACQKGAVTGFPQALSLATNGTEIGVAWTDSCSGVHFTRFAPDFTRLSETALRLDGTNGFALASTSSGWVVAAVPGPGYGDGPLTLAQLGSDGGLVSTQVLASVTGRTPQLVSGPGGVILLTELNTPLSDVLSGQLLDATGSPSGGTLSLGGTLGCAAVGVDDGFALAVVVDTVTIDLVHLALDGTTTAGATFSGDNGEAVSIAWSGSELRVLHFVAGATLAVSIERAAGDGTLTGAPLAIDPMTDVGASILALGSDTVVFAGSLSNASSLSLERWTPAPAQVWPAVAVVAPPYYLSTAPAAVQQGGDAVLAWIDRPITTGAVSTITLERVRITP